MSKAVAFATNPLGSIIGGKTGKLIGSATLIAAGVASGNPQLIAMGVAQGMAALSTPNNQRRQASVLEITLGEQPREAILGEAVTGGGLADAFNYGGKYGTDWEVLIVPLADHKCDALVGFWVNDKYVAFTDDGEVPGYKGQLKVYWRSGDPVQTLPQIVLEHGPGWTPSDYGAGIAYVVVAYKADKPDAKKPVWSGRPRFKWRVKGARCYIARKDGSLPGGSGPHRRDDPSTWEWTDNLIDGRYSWVRGFHACDRVGQPDQLLIGRGLSAIEAPPANSFAPANLCDEPVDGEKRYRIGGVIRSDEPFIDTEQSFAAACGGVIVQPEGSVEIEPAQAKAAVVTITDDDLLVGSQIEYDSFLGQADGEWVNTVVPRFVDPGQMWNDHAAPIRRDASDLIADGGSREETFSMRLVNWPKQAGRIGEIRRRMGRLWKRGAITLGPRFCELEEGDWIVWNSPRYVRGTATFRIESYLLNEKWHNRLRLRQMNASVFSEGAFLADEAAAHQPAPPPAIGAPGPGSWLLTAQQLGAATQIPVLVVSGAADDPYAGAIVFEYRADDGSDPAEATDWIGGEPSAASLTRKEIASIASDTAYHVAVSYVVDGERSERLILGPVTTGTLNGVPSGGEAGDFVFDGGNAEGVMP